MKLSLASRGQVRDAITREQHHAAAVTAGRAKRARNRELLLQREREHEGNEPQTAAIMFVRGLLCGLFFLPLFGLVLAFVYRVHQFLGAVPAWITGVAGFFLVASAVYHAPRVLRASTRDVVGLVRGWRRDPETFWWGAAWIAATLTLVVSGVIRISH